MFTDLRDLSEFGCCWFEVRGLIPDTLHEQIDCCAIGTRFEWAKLDQALAGNSETFLAGGEQTKSRRLDTEQLHEGGGVTDHVLAIVENEQRMPIGEMISDLLQGVVASAFDAAAARDRSARGCSAGHWRQVHEVTAVGVITHLEMSDLDSQTCLAAAASAHDDNRVAIVETCQRFGNSDRATNKGSGQRWHRRQRGIDRAQRSESLIAKLEEFNSVSNISNALAAKRSNRDVLEAGNGRSAQNRLAWPGHFFETSGGVQCGTEVLVVALKRLAIGDTDAQRKRRVALPVGICKVTMDCLARSNGVVTILEGGTKRITGPTKDLTIVVFQCGTHDGVVDQETSPCCFRVSGP